MSRKSIWVFFFLLFMTTSPVFSAENVREPSPRLSHEDLTQKAIRERFKIYQEQRFEKMPYLDRRLIREMATPQEVSEKIHFVSSEGQKNLQEVLRRSIQAHTPAKAAWERVLLSKRRILVALRNLFPEASYEVASKNGSLSALEYNGFNYRFKFRQPVFRGGIMWNTLLQEKAELEAAQNNFDDVIGDLIKNVSEAYFEYDRTKQVVQDYQHDLEKLKKLRDISEQKFKEGLVSEIEHLNAQSLYGQIQYDSETAKQELELAKLELQRYLNLEMQDDFDIKPLYRADAILNQPVLETGKPGSASLGDRGIFNFDGEISSLKMNDLVDMAYKHRPELRMESAKLESARLGQKIKTAKFLPQADVVLEFGKLTEWFVVTPEHGLRPEFRLMVDFNWNVAGNKINYTLENDQRAPNVTQFSGETGSQEGKSKFSAGLWDGLNDLVESKEAEVKKLDQLIELEKAEKQVIQDVKKAYYDYEKAQIQMRSSIQRAQYLQRRAELTQHKMEKNEAEISEYLEAEKNFMQELASLRKAVADYFKARASLNHAVGVPDFLKLEKGDKK